MKILISTTTFAQFDDAPLKRLKQAGFEPILNPYSRKLKEDESIKLLQGVIGLIAGTEPLTGNVLKKAKTLKIVSRCGVGADNVDREVAEELGIKVFTTPDAPTQAVTELTIGLMLDLLRRISREDRLVRSGVWQKNMGNLLSEKTLGILGLGRIGKRVVELTLPFDLKYIAWDISPDQQFADKYKVRFMELGELLKKSDIVTIHLPYTFELKGIIGERELNLMKRDAILLNTARGELVDEIALYNALKGKRIAGTALDVFEQEPYTGPLREMDNVILTPHIGSYAVESRVDMELQAVKNLIEGLKNA